MSSENVQTVNQRATIGSKLDRMVRSVRNVEPLLRWNVFNQHPTGTQRTTKRYGVNADWRPTIRRTWLDFEQPCTAHMLDGDEYDFLHVHRLPASVVACTRTDVNASKVE